VRCYETDPSPCPYTEALSLGPSPRSMIIPSSTVTRTSWLRRLQIASVDRTAAISAGDADTFEPEPPTCSRAATVVLNT